MSVTSCLCPLCQEQAIASNIDGEMRARVYCKSCTDFDITRLAYEEIGGSTELLHALSAQARATPAGKILVIMRSKSGGPRYEVREPKSDRPAPAWLPVSNAE